MPAAAALQTQRRALEMTVKTFLKWVCQLKKMGKRGKEREKGRKNTKAVRENSGNEQSKQVWCEPAGVNGFSKTCFQSL